LAPGAPGIPSTPLSPFAPFFGVVVTIFCTLGERRSSVTAPFAMLPVWMRPVASAVPPAMAMNAAAEQASRTLVRMVDPFSCVRARGPFAAATGGRRSVWGARSGTKEDMSTALWCAPP
jgi:hypothetical protein